MRLRHYCGFCGGPLGALTGSKQVCAACGEAYYHNAKPCAAVIILDHAGRVLLGRRAIEPALGLWDLPGGFCDPDETPEACAVREVMEETGCTIRIERFLDHLIDVYGSGGDHTLNAVFTARIVTGEPTPADDVAELRWYDLTALPPVEQLAFANTRRALVAPQTATGRNQG